MNADAETEFASLDWVLEEEVLLSSDIVGIGVGVDASVPHAESNITMPMIAMKHSFLIRAL